MNVDFSAEHGRTAVIKLAVMWGSCSRSLTRCGATSIYGWRSAAAGRGEHERGRSANIDLENGMARYPVTKSKAFEMPLSDPH